jgi:hypothetical protein
MKWGPKLGQKGLELSISYNKPDLPDFFECSLPKKFKGVHLEKAERYLVEGEIS